MLQGSLSETSKSWKIAAPSIHATNFDLSVKNPGDRDVAKYKLPHEILEEIATLDAESANMLDNIRALL